MKRPVTVVSKSIAKATAFEEQKNQMEFGNVRDSLKVSVWCALRNVTHYRSFLFSILLFFLYNQQSMMMLSSYVANGSNYKTTHFKYIENTIFWEDGTPSHYA